MSWPHDTPAPGRFSLGRVVAARDRARSARPFVPRGCTQQGRHDETIPASAEACTEVGADQWRPLSRGEYIHFWIVVDVAAFLCYALIVWVLKA